MIELLEDVRKSISKSELLCTQAITSLGNINLRSLLITSLKEPTQKCNTRYKRLSDPVKAWLDDRSVLGVQYETDKQKAHSDFINYCWYKRLNRLEINVLGRELSKQGVQDKRVGAGNESPHLVMVST